MHPSDEAVLNETRRQFFAHGARGLGVAALATHSGQRDDGRPLSPNLTPTVGGQAGLPHFAPKAKRAIYLHMLGAPPQIELFDYKPGMSAWFDKDLPDSVRMGQRLTTMTSGQTRFPIAPSVFKFKQYGQNGAWVSELLPYTAKMADDIAILRSLHTEAINHEPAITFLQTGFMIAGKPCIGAWMAYGLGSMNQDLPTFVVLNASHSNPKANVQAISARLWSAGFLSAQYAGVALRSSGDPVLYINNPNGVPPVMRRRMLDALSEMNQIEQAKNLDPDTRVRIAQYEMAFRMQTSVPELTDLSKETESTYKLYGEDARKGGTFANSCLMARRLVERGVALRAGLSPRLGRTQFAAGGAAEPVQRHRPGLLGAGAGLEAVRPAGRYLSHLGWRIRPHHLLTGQAYPDRLRPRPPSALLQPLDGWWRRQGRYRARRDRRVFVQRGERPGAHPRPPGYAATPIRYRSREVHLQIPGPGSEADGCREGLRCKRHLNLNGKCDIFSGLPSSFQSGARTVDGEISY